MSVPIARIVTSAIAEVTTGGRRSAYLTSLTSAASLAHYKGCKEVTVIGGGGRSRCQKENGRVIKIAASHRRWTSECEWMCLHQFAYMVSRGDPASHGRAFQSNFAILVHNMLGADAGPAL
jgi:hypothetical protein